ncbi:MAG: universal stress protein [Gemmatimonadaceae bacterium]|nr:universal stress protein [Gemmatimonadaceae bacterium]
MSTMHAAPATQGAIDRIVLPDGPIIVATDTTPASDAAFPLAHALSSRSKAEILALSIIEPMNVPIYGVDGMVVSLEPMAVSESARESSTRAQLLRLVGSDAPWPVIVRSGDAPREIASAADAMRARLVVVGRGRHKRFDRVFGGESVLRIVQLGDAPVLAVQEGLTSPPRRVVIATDFSPFSLYAAQVAMTLVAPDATVWLLHVGPSFDRSVPFLRERGNVYREQADAAFVPLRSALERPNMKLEHVMVTGSPSDQLLDFITEHDADLVVTATHGYGFIRRMMLGSVAAAMMHSAPCSVLIVPGSARAVAESRARNAPNVRTRAFDTARLDQELAAFTNRNAGRCCMVEIDQDDLGAQVLGHELPLVGTSFDRRHDDLMLMFGTSTLKGQHLTHTIPHVTDVDVTTNAGGEDQVMRIAHAGGQTLVTLL